MEIRKRETEVSPAEPRQAKPDDRTERSPPKARLERSLEKQELPQLPLAENLDWASEAHNVSIGSAPIVANRRAPAPIPRERLERDEPVKQANFTTLRKGGPVEKVEPEKPKSHNEPVTKTSHWNVQDVQVEAERDWKADPLLPEPIPKATSDGHVKPESRHPGSLIDNLRSKEEQVREKDQVRRGQSRSDKPVDARSDRGDRRTDKRGKPRIERRDGGERRNDRDQKRPANQQEPTRFDDRYERTDRGPRQERRDDRRPPNKQAAVVKKQTSEDSISVDRDTAPLKADTHQVNRDRTRKEVTKEIEDDKTSSRRDYDNLRGGRGSGSSSNETRVDRRNDQSAVQVRKATGNYGPPPSKPAFESKNANRNASSSNENKRKDDASAVRDHNEQRHERSDQVKSFSQVTRGHVAPEHAASRDQTSTDKAVYSQNVVKNNDPGRDNRQRNNDKRPKDVGINEPGHRTSEELAPRFQAKRQGSGRDARDNNYRSERRVADKRPEGLEEFDTASESSDFGRRTDRNRLNKNREVNQSTQNRSEHQQGRNASRRDDRKPRESQDDSKSTNNRNASSSNENKQKDDVSGVREHHEQRHDRERSDQVKSFSQATRGQTAPEQHTTSRDHTPADKNVHSQNALNNNEPTSGREQHKREEQLKLDFGYKNGDTPVKPIEHVVPSSVSQLAAQDLEIKMASVKKVWDNSTPVLEKGDDSMTNSYNEPLRTNSPTVRTVVVEATKPSYSTSDHMSKVASGNVGYPPRVGSGHQSMAMSNSTPCAMNQQISSPPLESLRQHAMNQYVTGHPTISSPPAQKMFNTQQQVTNHQVANIYQHFASHQQMNVDQSLHSQLAHHYAQTAVNPNQYQAPLLAHQSNPSHGYVTGQPGQHSTDYRVNPAALPQNVAASQLMKSQFMPNLHALQTASNSFYSAANQQAATGYYPTQTTPQMQQQAAYGFSSQPAMNLASNLAAQQNQYRTHQQIPQMARPSSVDNTVGSSQMRSQVQGQMMPGNNVYSSTLR